MSQALTCMHIEVNIWGYRFDTLFVSLRDNYYNEGKNKSTKTDVQMDDT